MWQIGCVSEREGKLPSFLMEWFTLIENKKYKAVYGEEIRIIWYSAPFEMYSRLPSRDSCQAELELRFTEH